MQTKKTGFTLIELMIVVVIILLFMSMSLSYFGEYTEFRKLENTAKKLTDVLLTARTKTTAGDAGLCGDPSTSQVNYYSVEIFDGGTKFRLVPSCSIGTPQTITYAVEPNIAMEEKSVIYQRIGNSLSCQCIQITNTKIQKCAYVKAGQSGIIDWGRCGTCATCAVDCTCP